METTTPHSTKKIGLIGGLLGSAGLAASIFVLSASAGAAAPTLSAQADPAPAPVEDIEVAEDVEYVADDIHGEIPADWQAAVACWDAVAVDFGVDFEPTNESSIELDDSIDFEALAAAEEECEALLPQDVQDDIAADNAAFADYDACIDGLFEDAGIDVEAMELEGGEIEAFEADFGQSVAIADGEDYSWVDFGDGDGSVTITKTGDDITVTTTGDVDVQSFDDEGLDADFEAFDNALESCDNMLPEGFEFDDGMLATGGLEAVVED